MAKVVMKGFFGVKQTFNVASAAIGGTPYDSNQAPTGTWYAGQLFKLTAASTGLGNGVDAYVAVNTTSGSAIMGVALENSADYLLPVNGMSQPSGSKVTLLHGHSEFEIIHGSGTKTYEQGSTKGNVESASLMSLLYSSANGKWTNLVSHAASGVDQPPQPIGFVTKVPSASNNYTLGVVLFG
jgi:hypothetical protein